MSGTLEDRIQRLEDIEAIRRLKYRYMSYADDGYDADGIVTLMTPDAVWDGGEAFGRQEGAEAFGNMVREVGKQISFAAHLALGAAPIDAVQAAKTYVTRGIAGGAGWKLGRGNGPIDHFGWSSTEHRP